MKVEMSDNDTVAMEFVKDSNSPSGSLFKYLVEEYDGWGDAVDILFASDFPYREDLLSLRALGLVGTDRDEYGTTQVMWRERGCDLAEELYGIRPRVGGRYESS